MVSEYCSKFDKTYITKSAQFILPIVFFNIIPGSVVQHDDKKVPSIIKPRFCIFNSLSSKFFRDTVACFILSMLKLKNIHKNIKKLPSKCFHFCRVKFYQGFMYLEKKNFVEILNHIEVV